MFGVGALSRTFLLGLNYPEFHGIDKFIELLDARRDPSSRSKGLLTGRYHVIVLRLRHGLTGLVIVSNHTSVYVRTSSLGRRDLPVIRQLKVG